MLSFAWSSNDLQFNRTHNSRIVSGRGAPAATATRFKGRKDVQSKPIRSSKRQQGQTGDFGALANLPGVFAGGDMIPSQRNIDAFLRGEKYQPKAKHEIADVKKMNTWYYSDAPRTVRPMLDVVRRTSGFAEVVGNLDEHTAVFEARRCMSCGNCFECDNCYGVCPDNAVIKLGTGNRFKFNYDYCKGCGICVSECPCGAIKMVAEEI